MTITSVTFRVQKNSGGANTPLIIVVGGTTGQFEDTTSSEAYTASSEINFSSITEGTVGLVALIHAGLLFTNTESASNIKTFNGLVRASTKTVNGLALASLKTWNGLT